MRTVAAALVALAASGSASAGGADPSTLVHRLLTAPIPSSSLPTGLPARLAALR